MQRDQVLVHGGRAGRRVLREWGLCGIGQGSLSFHEALAAAQGPQTLPSAKVNLTLTWGVKLPGAVEVRSWQLGKRSQVQRFRFLSPGWGEGLSNCSPVYLMSMMVTQAHLPAVLVVAGKTSTGLSVRQALYGTQVCYLLAPLSLSKSLPLLIWKSGTLISTLHGYRRDKAHVKLHATTRAPWSMAAITMIRGGAKQRW